MVRALLLVFLVVGCASVNLLSDETIYKWNQLSTESKLEGIWEGKSPDENYVAYEFHSNLSCTWTVGNKPIPCKYRYARHQDGLRLQVYAMEGQQFKDVEFIAWVKIHGTEMIMYGYPTRYGRLQSGEKAYWPDKLERESILFAKKNHTN